MDKSSIKNFAVWARKKLMEDIKQKAYEIGITENGIEEAKRVSSDTVEVRGRYLKKYEIRQRESLVSKIREKGFNQIVEEVAYTWFNRFIALRFMEVNEYLPTSVRVLSSVEPGKAEPDIIRQFEYIDLGLEAEEIEFLRQLQDTHDTENLYRYLLVKQCNKLNEILPGLFEEIADYTEILLPNNLLQEGSIIRRLVQDVQGEDFKNQVEIIGWLYQYYISEKKDEVFEGLKKNIKITKENIPAATQLFTPDWIVKYMVENSLGRLWLEGHPNDELKSKWKYYLEEAEQEMEVQRQLEEIREKSKELRPEDIKVLDPCIGSGHILVYAFDVLYDIYKSAGYSERDIPRLILENNLYGLDIDDRAAQLAYFAVMMKARSKSRRIFREKISLNICSIQESNGFPEEAIRYFAKGYNYISGDRLKRYIKDSLIDWEIIKNLDDLSNESIEIQVKYLINTFYDAKEYGSILEVKKIDFDAIEKRLEEIRNGETLDMFELQYKNIILEKLPPLVKQARIMSEKYDVVVTNPPYMGKKSINDKVGRFLNQFFPNTKGDMGTVFMELCIKLSNPCGFVSMINIPSWMFLTSYEALRNQIINNYTIINMLHNGRGIFGSDFGTTTFVIRNVRINNYIAIYRQLYFRQGAVDSVEEKEKIFFSDYGIYKNKQESFRVIEGFPIAYWLSNSMKNAFEKGTQLSKIGNAKQGLATSDNDRFVRIWHEVNYNKIGFGMESKSDVLICKRKWFPYNKGGQFRKWYGNNIFIINWENDGQEIKNFKRAVIRNESFYFKEGITWTLISSSLFGVRISTKGFIFDVNGMTLFVDEEKLYFILSFMCSKVCFEMLRIINSTMAFQVGDINRLAILFDFKNIDRINYLSKENVDISKLDWDSFETSWDFKKHPLLIHKGNSKTIEQSFNNWSDFAEKQFNQLKANEEELNRIFIEIYGLQDELTPEVEDKDITIRKADRVRDIKSFISYAVGCMLGRYSIDAEGLIYAGGEWKDKWRLEDGKWKVKRTVKDDEGNIIEENWVDATFAPDEDNVLPILDDEYFEDDIVSRFIEFVKVTFGEDTLEENLDYIAETLGRKSSETSRQTIRRYFLKDFYKDHLQTYQKKPIYWLFDSGKNDGFKALIYMHRYDEFTVAKVRTDYLHKLQKKYDAELKRLDIVLDSNVSQREKANARKKKEKIQKQMQECLQYDQVIAHIANQRIKIDLDDGVTVNYAKFQGVEVPQGEGKKPLKADLLAKI